MLFPKKYWEDPTALHVGTEKPAAYLIPYGSQEEAQRGGRESSEFFHSLNGTWRFRFCPSVLEAEEAFWEMGYDDSQWGSIPVPGMWQTNGYDTAQYLTSPYPFLYDPPRVPRVNPAGLYRRTVTVHKKEGKEYYLVFEGVDACLSVAQRRFCGVQPGPSRGKLLRCHRIAAGGREPHRCMRVKVVRWELPGRPG